jgi:hypothetical protein
MRQSTVSLRALFVALAVTMPVLADAPTEGPDRQYDPFTASDKVISDSFTKLVWDRPSSYPPLMSHDAAVAFCGLGPRRLPTLKELLTLVDEEPHFEYDGTQNTQRMIDPRAFHGTPPEPFWTSTFLAGPGAGFATVEFVTGGTSYSSVTDSKRVRCVVSQ